MMKTILITGAGGFIASHLCERLLNEGNKIIGVDNLISGDKKNIEYLQKIGGDQFEFHEIDISTDDFIEKFKDIKINEIFNLACPASPLDFAEYGIEILDVSSKGTMNVLKLSKITAAKLLYTSSSEVYGDPLESPQTEEYNGNVSCNGPRSCYDEGKRFSESYIINYSKKHNIDYRIVRIFNTYGPRMRKNDGRVIPNFIEQLKSNKPLSIFGDGKQTRSFCYVSDTVNGLILFMNHNELSFDLGQRIINLGNPNEITIMELAKILSEIMSVNLKTENYALMKDDPKKRCPNITKAKKLINFTPKITLEDGLKRTIKLWNQ